MRRCRGWLPTPPGQSRFGSIFSQEDVSDFSMITFRSCGKRKRTETFETFTKELGAAAKEVGFKFGDGKGDGSSTPTVREEIRTLGVVFASSEQPFSEEDWRFTGPRTCIYYGNEIVKIGFGAMSQHNQWKFENKLQDDEGLFTEA